MVGMRPGAKPNKKQKFKSKVVKQPKPDAYDEALDDDLDDLDSIMDLDDTYNSGYDDYDEDLDENENRNTKVNRNKNYQNQKNLHISSRDDNKKKLLMMLIGFVAIVIIVLAVVLVFGGKDKKKDAEENTIGQVPTQQATQGNTGDVTGGSATPPQTNQQTQDPTMQQDLTNQQGNVNPGLPDTKNGNKMTNGGEMSDPKGFISDVNGNKIPKDFVVQRVADETDFVNYIKRRGITGDGVELLWLDAQYKGIPYSVQVPFKIWKELDPQGITVVDMEVLYLENGAKVVSYMKVKDNYKEILEDRN
ncbi:hypothetical protein [Paraclostridium bifermentans]|uniref:hypothetical protein n=1 Tax=Paraclostridium bifermentans TaxID=1490 RepID=UPI00374FA6EC